MAAQNLSNVLPMPRFTLSISSATELPERAVFDSNLNALFAAAIAANISAPTLPPHLVAWLFDFLLSHGGYLFAKYIVISNPSLTFSYVGFVHMVVLLFEKKIEAHEGINITDQ